MALVNFSHDVKIFFYSKDISAKLLEQSLSFSQRKRLIQANVDVNISYLTLIWVCGGGGGGGGAC